MESFVMLIIGLALGSIIVGIGIMYSKLNDRICDLNARVDAYQHNKIYKPLNYKYTDYRNTPVKTYAQYSDETSMQEEKEEEIDG